MNRWHLLPRLLVMPVSALLMLALAGAAGCSRKTRHGNDGAVPSGTYRRAVDAADSAAAKAGRRAVAGDSMSTEDK